jgi:protein TonB
MTGSRQFAVSVALSVTIHAGVLAALSTWGGRPREAAVDDRIYVFLGTPGAAGGRGGAALAGGAPGLSAGERERAEEKRSAPTVSAELEVTKEPARVDARPAVPAPPLSRPVDSVGAAKRRSGAEHGSDPSAVAARPEVSNGGAGGGDGVGGGPGGRGGTAAYEQVLAAWLDRHKYYPSSLRRRGIEGQGKLRIRIARSGELIGVEVASSFSHPSLEEISREWVRRAQPFPPVPESLAGDDFEFIVPIGFRLR